MHMLQGTAHSAECRLVILRNAALSHKKGKQGSKVALLQSSMQLEVREVIKLIRGGAFVI